MIQLQAKIVDVGTSPDSEHVWVYMTVSHGDRGEQQATQVAWIPSSTSIEDAEMDIIEAARDVVGDRVTTPFMERLKGRTIEL